MAVTLRNNIWQISWPNPNRPGHPFRESTGMKNVGDSEQKREIKLAAQAMEGAKRKLVAEGERFDIKKQEKIRFEDFAQLFVNNHLKVNTKNWKRNYGQTLIPENRHGLVHFFKGKFLDEIKPLDIEAFKQFRTANGVLPSTINQDLMCLATMYRKAIAWEKVIINPMDKVKKFKAISHRLRYFTKDELKIIVDYVQEPMKSMVSLAANTGMRITEIISLKWADIDFTKNLLCIDTQKNGKIDYIPIKHVRNLLMKIRRQGNSEFVFNKSINVPYSSYYTVSHSFKDILNHLKIKGACFHTLRHTFASHLAMAGVDLYRISKLMRHSSIKMTERYAHLSKQHVDQAVEVLAAQFDGIFHQESNYTNITHGDIEKEKEEFEKAVSQIDLSS